MLQRHTMAIVPCGNPTPKKLPTGGGERPTFRTARTAHSTPPLQGEGEFKGVGGTLCGHQLVGTRPV